MSEHKQAEGEHGTLISYVIGFILSLILTGIAYFFVVNKSISGKVLLGTILGVALLQMCVQIFFFLHLGRGPKPLYNVVFFLGTIGLIVVVVVGSIFIMDNLHYNMSSSEVTKKLSQNENISQVNGEKTGACQETKVNHKVVLGKTQANPFSTTANLCDTITFVNEQASTRRISFGPHDAHGTYGGETEVTVTKARAKTITLNESGSFSFHDETDTALSGTFTVAP